MNIRLIPTIATTVLAVAVLSIALTACSALAPSRQQQDIAGTCIAIAAAENAYVLAAKAGKVTPAATARVQQWIALKQPVCNVTPEPASIPAALYAVLLQAAPAFTAAAQGKDVPAPPAAP